MEVYKFTLRVPAGMMEIDLEGIMVDVGHHIPDLMRFAIQYFKPGDTTQTVLLGFPEGPGMSNEKAVREAFKNYGRGVSVCSWSRTGLRGIG